MHSYDDLTKYQFLDSIEGVPEPKKHVKEPLWKQLKAYFSGIMICFIVALAGTFISNHYAVPSMLICLLLGMSLHYMSQESPTKRGVQYTSQSILRFGVILIGARIALSDFMAFGIEGIGLVAAASTLTIVASMVWAKTLNLDNERGILIGGATAICGASAALAISSVMPPSKDLEKNTLLAVLGVTAMGTIAMIAYPVAIGFLGLSDYQAGVLIGGTIHDVSQVVGAGYSISTEAGDTAILIKLMRVFLLIPILIVFALAFKNKGNAKTGRKLPFPLFLIGFFILMLLNSMHILPQEVMDVLKYVSGWFLIMAITAVGMKTSLKVLFSVGWKPFFLVALDALTITTLYCLVLFAGVI